MSERLWVIAYDIADAKRWRKVFQLLKAYGKPVQFSVFECHLRDTQLRALLQKLETLIHAEEDRLHCWPLCNRCDRAVRTLGRGGRVEALPQAWIVSDAP